ncbi:hypothetical protein [Arcobacter sp. LA11]|uniref:hypothetical protein n=1 Tax=Arcobacter sp. LA11 TaxID=1898176 RepID=UPI0009347EC9|nr:hypothetical protein [Arcobacter sp. LA11]
MSFLRGLSLYFYKVLFLILLFPIGAMVITPMFGSGIVGAFFFGACLFLLSIMKFREFFSDPVFDFDTFVLVILIIPIIIDFGFKLTYENFYFFNSMEFTYDIVIKYLYHFYDNYMLNFFTNLSTMDITIKKFYIEGIALFVMIKYFVSQSLNYLLLDYILIAFYLYKKVFR